MTDTTPPTTEQGRCAYPKCVLPFAHHGRHAAQDGTPPTTDTEPATEEGKALIEAAHRGDIRGRLVASILRIEEQASVQRINRVSPTGERAEGDIAAYAEWRRNPNRVTADDVNRTPPTTDTEPAERPEPTTKAGQDMESWLREPEDYAWGRRVTNAILAIEREAAERASEGLDVETTLRTILREADAEGSWQFVRSRCHEALARLATPQPVEHPPE